MDPTPPPPANPVPPPPAAPQYEFTEPQNKVIGDLARSMIWVSAPILFVGVLYVIAGVVNLVSVGIHLWAGDGRADLLVNAGFLLLAAVLVLFIGSKLRAAAARFQAVVETSGRDISHLMDGLASLGGLFRVLAAFVRIYVLLILILLVAAIVTAAVGYFRRADMP